ncbi:MAG: outer membrane lipoprotein-sorting protein [Verrucomicrobiales bacterium]
MPRFLTRRHWLATLALLPLPFGGSVPSLPSRAQETPDPTAEEIQRIVKLSYIRQKMSLKGRLRNDQTGAEAPFELSMLENTIRFRFDNPIQIINLDLNDKGFVLREVVRGKNAPVPRTKYTEKIRGTDITYEDVSLRFLYWPNPVKLDKENVKHRTCWKLRLNNPDTSGAYGVAFIWVDSGSGGIMRMEGFDREGKLIKRYEIISGMKVSEGGWMLKQMRIESFDPATRKRTGRSYLELDKA